MATLAAVSGTATVSVPVVIPVTVTVTRTFPPVHPKPSSEIARGASASPFQQAPSPFSTKGGEGSPNQPLFHRYQFPVDRSYHPSLGPTNDESHVDPFHVYRSSSPIFPTCSPTNVPSSTGAPALTFSRARIFDHVPTYQGASVLSSANNPSVKSAIRWARSCRTRSAAAPSSR